MSTTSQARRLLLPLTPVYRLTLALRELRLRRGWEPVRRLGFPVVSVGNLSTGGTGKTPFVIALGKALTERGFAIDVLSRGYGRNSAAAARVDPGGSADEFGDEPLLIAREAGVPVYVAAERYEAGVLAEGSRNLPSGAKAPVHLDSGNVRAEAGTLQSRRVHILDDGFQHRRLYRDVNILLLNGEDWRGRLLPMGNLREPRRSANRADVIAIPESEPELEPELRAQTWNGPIWRVRRHMDLPSNQGPVAAFCGIARSEQFFAGLEKGGFHLATRIAFRDHHRYTASDLERIQTQAHSARAGALITTAKDSIRLEPLLKLQKPELPLMTAGLRIEIQHIEEAIDWLAGRLCSTEVRPPL
ncbi:MAG TPA: tetraacyldisaccharide 4'-kinase [Terracidiphilus sp.]